MPPSLPRPLTQPEADDHAKNFMEWELIDRPGFLIRRMHQIHVALFAAHCGAFDITPVQNSVLWALARRGKADQTTIAADVALDRTTTVGALKRLAARRLVARSQSRTDRRAQLCVITPEGTALLANIETFARSAHRDTIAILSADEQKSLISLLQRVVIAAGAA